MKNNFLKNLAGGWRAWRHHDRYKLTPHPTRDWQLMLVVWLILLTAIFAVNYSLFLILNNAENKQAALPVSAISHFDQAAVNAALEEIAAREQRYNNLLQERIKISDPSL